MILIEITAAINAAGALQTFYVSDGEFQTEPTDTPANVAFDACLIDPGSIGLHAFSDGRTGGGTRLEIGEIVLPNVDGQYDAWVNYSFDGLPITIRAGEGGPYPNAFPVLLAGTAEGVEASFSQVVIRLRDKQYIFEQPARTVLYGGTNVLPAGLDGVPGDLKGKPRPVALGKVLNVAPPMVNTSRLIYEVGACQSVDAVYDGGAALTAGAPYASQADMEANAPAAGFFRAWPAGGYFRLGLDPSAQLTADLTQGASAAERTAGQVLKRLALAAGLSSAEVSAADVAALDAANSAEVGVWLDDASMTFARAMDAVAASVGAWYGFDGAGVLRMGRLAAPTGAPALTLYEGDYLDGLERRPPRDNGRPVWSVTVNHSKIWAVQESGLLGSVSAERRGYLQQQYRAANAQDAAIKTQWKMAETLEVDTVLTSAAAAEAEAARLLALHKVRRDIFDVPVPLELFAAAGLRLMDVVAVQGTRFGMQAGRSFRLIGIGLNTADNTATLTLWG